MTYFNLFILNILTLILLNSNSIQAQCVVDVGVDKYICVDRNGIIDTTSFDGIVLNGIPPYKVHWECTYDLGLQSIPVLTASDFLEDSTLLNAKITTYHIGTELLFYLNIEDALGNTCRDSLWVYFSLFGAFPDFPERTIFAGDSVQIYSLIGGGIPPTIYAWTPNYNISDTTVAVPIVWPEQDQVYTVRVTDSVGCENTFLGTDWIIYVNPVSVTEPDDDNLAVKVYPNPVSSTSVLEILGNEDQELSIQISNLKGEHLVFEKLGNEAFPIGQKIQSSGAYFFSIYQQDKVIYSDRFVIP